MSLSERLFGKGSPAVLDLALVQRRLGEGVARYAGRPADLDLVRARLADRCRDAGLGPALPEKGEELSGGVGGEGVRRRAGGGAVREVAEGQGGRGGRRPGASKSAGQRRC